MTHQPVNVTVLASCLERGGAETMLFHLLLGLDRTRFRPRLICVRNEPGTIARELHTRGIPLVYGFARNKYDPFVGRRLVQAIGRQTDLLYCLDQHQILFWTPYLLHRIRVAASLLTCHATRNPNGGRVFSALDWPALRSLQCIVAVAHGQKEDLIQHEGIPAERIAVIQNGVATKDFHACNSQLEDRAIVRQEWGFHEKHEIAVIVAQLRPEKNHSLFLRVARRVAEHLPAARFVIVGDGPERTKLQDYAQTLNISHLVRFTGVRHDIPRVLAAADVVTLTSRTETFPMALLEGMAAGKPIVATRVGSIPEMVGEEESGYLINLDDEEAFAEALQELLSSRAKAKRMGEAGRRTVMQHFTLEQMVRGYEELFQELLHDAHE